MRRLLLVALVFGILGLVASVASAQTVTNPTKAVITVGPDHAEITRYELGWFLGGVDPVQVADIGTGPAVAGVIERPLPTYPIGVTYTGKVRGYVGAAVSEWSPTSNPFSRLPGAAVGLAVQK